jgi:hypothetical protein
MEADRAFAFGSRPDKNADGPNSNSGSSALDMRSVGIKHFKNKLNEYIRLAARRNRAGHRPESRCRRTRSTCAGPQPIGFGCASARCRPPGVDQATAVGWRRNAGPKAGDDAHGNLGRFAGRSISMVLAEDRYPSNGLWDQVTHSNAKYGTGSSASAPRLPRRCRLRPLNPAPVPVRRLGFESP